MATIIQTQNQFYNVEKLLGIVNPYNGSWTCVGYAPSQNRRCRNAIAVHNKMAADVLLRSLARGTITDSQLHYTLHEIAGYLLCRRYHQVQAASVATQWHAIIMANLSIYGAQVATITLVNPSHDPAPMHNPGLVHNPGVGRSPGPSSIDVVPSADLHGNGARDEAEARGRTNENIQEQNPRAARPIPEPAPPSRSTVRRAREAFIVDLEAQERSRREAQAEIERARQEAEARRFAAEECIRQEAAAQERAQQQWEPLRLILQQRVRQLEERVAAVEQQTRERAEQDQTQWSEAWTRYERDWENMVRINTVQLDENVKESIPWPVRSGRWEDVSPGNVRRFFQNAPPGEPNDPTQFQNLLMLIHQMMRWNEDGIRRSFPRIADDQEALALVVVVSHVLTTMVEDSRRT